MEATTRTHGEVRPRKDVQAKNIPDRDVLVLIERLRVAPIVGRVIRLDELEARLAFPPKVVLAKLRALIKRGLLYGCACGCAGGFRLTAAGEAALV